MLKKRFVKVVFASLLVLAMAVGLAGCEAASSSQPTPTPAADTPTPASQSTSPADPAPVANTDPITVVWYPNESADNYAPARDEFARLVSEATGRTVETQLTTDYTIAIESLASGAADIGAAMGAVGYIEAQTRNPEVEVLVVNSGSSGTLDDAIYYSWICANVGDETQYAAGDSFDIANIEGKSMSFVSNSSTSGFRVPTTGIIDFFADRALTEDDLVEGGPFFSEVLFGNTHQGSAVNLLAGNSDLAAFCDTEMVPYMDISSGEENTVGAVYQVKADADDPFAPYAGQEVVVIACTPVLNGPTAINPANFTADEIEAIRALLTSDEVAANDQIFIQEGSDKIGMYKEGQRYLRVEDEWYDPIRNM